MIPTCIGFKACWLKNKMLLAPIFGFDTIIFTKGKFTGHELVVCYEKHFRIKFLDETVYRINSEQIFAFRKLRGVEINRSSRPEVFCKKGVLRNFTKFTGKHLCQSLFFNKVAGLKPATLLKKRLWHRCFPVNFVKFLRTPFFTEHLWWLLLD